MSIEVAAPMTLVERPVLAPSNISRQETRLLSGWGSTFPRFIFNMAEIMRDFSSYPATEIEERIIMEDETMMIQLRPAMHAIESGKFLDVAIPHTRTTPPDNL